jgi:hypothetical protein
MAERYSASRRLARVGAWLAGRQHSGIFFVPSGRSAVPEPAIPEHICLAVPGIVSSAPSLCFPASGKCAIVSLRMMRMRMNAPGRCLLPRRRLLPRFFRRSSAFTSSRSHPPFACPRGRAGRCPGNADAFLPRYLPRNLPRFFRGCGLVAAFSTGKLVADRPQAFLFEGVSEDGFCVTCMQVPSLSRSARLACARSLQHPNDASLGCCNDPAQARCALLPNEGTCMHVTQR